MSTRSCGRFTRTCSSMVLLFNPTTNRADRRYILAPAITWEVNDAENASLDDDCLSGGAGHRFGVALVCGDARHSGSAVAKGLVFVPGTREWQTQSHHRGGYSV